MVSAKGLGCGSDIERIDMKHSQDRELTFIEQIRALDEDLFRLVEAYVGGVHAASTLKGRRRAIESGRPWIF